MKFLIPCLPTFVFSYWAIDSLAQIPDNKAADGTVTLESAGWEGGRLLPGTGTDKILYVVKDHLGSVRVVKDGTGAIRQRFDYYPYGTVSRSWTSSATTDDSEKRYRFGGKEVAGSALTDLAGMGAAPGAPYLDFGARLYSPRTAMWLSADPLAEKYYGIGQNVYCAGDPVNLVDPKGMDYWILSRDGSLTHLCDNKENRLYAVDKDNRITGEYFQDYTTNRLFEQLKNKYSKTDENKHKTYNVSSVENLSGNVALQLFKFLSDNTYVEWAMHGTTEFTVGTLHDSSDGGNWSMYGLDSRPKFSIHSHPGDNNTTDEEQRISASDDWDNMKKSPESKAKYYYIYFPVTGTYSRLKTTHMQKNGPLPFFYNKIKRD